MGHNTTLHRTRHRRSRFVRERRTGAAALEFAVTAIPLFLFFFASVAFGRAMMATQSLEEAARAGCRMAVLNAVTTQDIEAEVDRLMDLAGIHNYTMTVSPDPPSDADTWEPITVRVEATFDAVSWLPLPRYLGGKTFSASCTLPREGNEISSETPES